jgi:hypothetical protein
MWIKEKPPMDRNNQYNGEQFSYGMKLRGFSIGCQPMKGLIERRDDPSGRYHDILVYDHRLPWTDLFDYELEFIG